MKVAKERSDHLNEFIKTPRTMEECCENLRILIGSEVHKVLLRTIIQYTGYGKLHVNQRGQLSPRVLRADGTKTTQFAPPFTDMVDEFLDDRKGGTILFPSNLPGDPGWKDSFWDLRLTWEDNKEDIRKLIMLLFENIKDNGTGGVDLKDIETPV